MGTKINCKKCKRVAVVFDQGIPLCGDCYCKQEQIGEYETNEQDNTNSGQDNKLAFTDF